MKSYGATKMSKIGVPEYFNNVVTEDIRKQFRIGSKDACGDWCIKGFFNVDPKKVTCELMKNHENTHMSLTDDYCWIDGVGSALWFEEKKK